MPPAAPGSRTSAILQLELTGLANQWIQVKRFVVGRTSPLETQLRTDPIGRLALPVATDQIVMLSSGADSTAEPLLFPIRSDPYIHRQAPQQGWASLDALNAVSFWPCHRHRR